MERIYFEEVIQKVVENKLCKASQKNPQFDEMESKELMIITTYTQTKDNQECSAFSKQLVLCNDKHCTED